MKLDVDFSELHRAAAAVAGVTTDTLIGTMPKCGVTFPASYDEPVYVMPKYRVEEHNHGVEIYISAEDGDGVADYWGQWNNEIPYIHPKLEAWAESHGSYFEWQNAGCIVAFFEGVRS
jgi:hypothetical protein